MYTFSLLLMSTIDSSTKHYEKFNEQCFEIVTNHQVTVHTSSYVQILRLPDYSQETSMSIS